MLAAISCNEAACSSVRCDRSLLPAAIWLVTIAIYSVEPLAARVVPISFFCIRFIE
jgi:hypothetical protein